MINKLTFSIIAGIAAAMLHGTCNNVVASALTFRNPTPTIVSDIGIMGDIITSHL